MRKLFNNKKGFTLTEVMIGMTILTIAIVSATSLLVGLISTNQNNLHTLQANYLAMEGIEGVRNIRDTNWLHNRDWLGGIPALWGTAFVVPEGVAGENLYSLILENQAFLQGKAEAAVAGVQGLSGSKTWTVVDSAGEGVNWVNGVDSGFKRTVAINKYDCGEIDESGCNNYVLVVAKVSWLEGAKEREVSMSEVMTNWKGGAL